MLRQSSVICLLAAALLAGCADKSKEDASLERIKELAGGELKEVVSVRGTVFVNETPQEGVNLNLYDETGARQVATARTDKDGKYCWTTHQPCDGLEPGTYLLGFEYIPKPKRNDSGIDLFNGKYRNPRSGKFKLVVEKGAPQTAANYELELKK